MKKIIVLIALSCFVFGLNAQTHLQKPIAKIAGKTGMYDGLLRVVFCAQDGILAFMPDEVHTNVRAIITGFTATVERKDEILFTSKNRGARFNKETIEFFKTVRPGDKVYFTDITCSISTNKAYQLDPIGLRIY